MADYPIAKDGYWEYGVSGFPIVGGLDENVLDDFEDASLSEYGGARSKFEVQNEDVITGQYTLKGTSTGAVIGDNGGDIPTPRRENATEYRARVFCQDGGAAGLLACVQSESSPWTNCYAVIINANTNDLLLLKRRNGSSTYFELKSLDLQPNTEYWLFLTLTSNGINGGVRDTEETELYRTDSYYDVTFSGGGLGWRVSSDPPVLFDHATYHAGSMDSVTVVRLDGFEDGHLKEYDGPDSAGTQSAEPAAELDGDYGLEMDGPGSIFTAPGDGLENYIRDGVAFEAFFRPNVVDSEQYGLYLCPGENHETTDNTYELQFLMSGGMRIRKDTDGSEKTLHGSGTNESHYASTDAVTWEAENWYRVELLVDKSQPAIRADLYDLRTGDFIAYVEQDVDAEYMQSENGFGFACSSGGNWFVDELRELE